MIGMVTSCTGEQTLLPALLHEVEELKKSMQKE